MHLPFVQCSFVEHRNYKVIYRRYASLFFLVGIDNGEVSAHKINDMFGLFVGNATCC